MSEPPAVAAMGAVWDGLAMALPGGSTVLSRRASALVLARLLAAARADTARNGGGGRLSTEVAEIVTALRLSASGGHADIAPRSGGHADMVSAAGSPQWTDEMLPLKEAAKMLGLSDRHARRLANEGAFGEVDETGRGRQVSRLVVDAIREAKSEVAR